LQCAIYLLVRQANREHALAQIQSSLRTGARIFEKLIEQRNQQITTAAAILSRDHAFQEAFAGAIKTVRTTLSALASLRGRVRADAVLIASLDKELLFDTRRPQLHSVPFPFPKIDRQGRDERCTYAFVVLDRELYAIAIAPLLAPDPIAWLCPMSASTTISRVKSKSTTNLEITFSQWRPTCLVRRCQTDAPSLRMLRDRISREQVIDLRSSGKVSLVTSSRIPAENAHSHGAAATIASTGVCDRAASE